jgi:mRNA-degrading endonuclease HigB of HigAB toxin-antitoxin module
MRTFETLYWLQSSAEGVPQSVSIHEARFRYATAALIVIEMLLDKNIQWNEEKHLVALPTPPTHQLMHDIWEACTTPKKMNWYWQTGKRQDTALTLKDWLNIIVAGKFKIFEAMKKDLIAQNILQIETKYVLGIPYKKTRVISPETRLAYQNMLQDIIVGKEKVNIQTFILLKVIKSCKLNTLVYNPTTTKARNEFAAQLEIWANQKIDHENIMEFLEMIDFDRNLDNLTDMLDALVDVIDGIGDFGGDAGDGGGGDSGD